MTIDDGHLAAIAEVVDALREHGVEVSEVLEVTGQILGSVADDQVSAVRELDGVLAVDPDTAYQLPPPDADIQ